MKKYLATAALALLMTTAAYAKGNDFTILERKGNWTAYYQVSNLGNPMCGLLVIMGQPGQSDCYRLCEVHRRRSDRSANVQARLAHEARHRCQRLDVAGR